jgi:hypothetical protein
LFWKFTILMSVLIISHLQYIDTKTHWLVSSGLRYIDIKAHWLVSRVVYDALTSRHTSWYPEWFTIHWHQDTLVGILLFTLPYLQNLKHKLPFNFISTYHILGAVVKTVVMPSARKCVCCHELTLVGIQGGLRYIDIKTHWLVSRVVYDTLTSRHTGWYPGWFTIQFASTFSANIINFLKFMNLILDGNQSWSWTWRGGNSCYKLVPMLGQS